MQNTQLKSTFLALMLLALTACTGGQPEKPPTPPETYQVRGLIRHLPAADKPVQEVLIHHEALPNFKDDQGQVVGMDPMSMPFPVEDRTLLDGLAVGDKIEFEFEISWGGSPGLRLTRVTKLAEETELEFKKKKKTGATGHDSASGHSHDH